MGIVRVNENDFEAQVLRSELPVLVDLYADWCQPCKQLHPILVQLASELEGKLKIVQIDVEASPMLARSFGVQSIPMLVLIAGGRPVDQVLGLVDKKRLMQMIAPVLPRAANAVEPAELSQLLTARHAVPVDIRDAHAYGRYRIPGAVHVEAEELEARKGELAPSDGRIRVLYARTTDAAQAAATKLSESGVEVAYLTGGFLHWEADGLPVERGLPT